MESTHEIKNKQVFISRSVYLYPERQFLNLVLPKRLYSIKTSYDYYRTPPSCLFLSLVEYQLMKS